MGRITGRLFVGFTVSLICFIAYSSQVFVIWPWYGRVLSVELVVLLLPFNLLVGMLFWNYWLCVLTEPGRVPPGWEPNFHDSDGYEVKKYSRGPRYCRSCQSYKPPRAHHCSQCKRCVLRMDHHCPWVNNCVGHFNYGYFLRFLFFVDIATGYHLAMVTRRTYIASQSYVLDNVDTTQLVFIILNYVFAIPVFMSVGGFSLYHLYQLLKNTTTIEGWEKNRAATLIRRGKIQEVKFPYHLGWRRNVQAVLGRSPLLWCWPTPATGTGLKYQVAYDDDSSVEAWPPQDPDKEYLYPEPDPDHEFELPESPWTYENGALNPALQSSNAQLRSRRRKPRGPGHAALPPYHPDFGKDAAEDEDACSSGESDEYNARAVLQNLAAPRVRRGSEGYEVQSVGREEMLQRFLECRLHEPGRYQTYEPEAASEPETDEDAPLVAR